jgi:hypothetical protein
MGLVAAPAALANGDTINARHGEPFSGVVDNFPSCSDATRITINWGDGSSSPGQYDTNGNVTGTHTYGSGGKYNGTVTLTGGTCPAGTSDTFTAVVAQFTQCPAVYQNGGCQFLIVSSDGGTTILQDSNEGPYEGVEDALIGVQNNSSKPISAIPISASGSDLFSFDNGLSPDGLCNPGGPPVPGGCVPAPGEPAGSTCGPQGDVCSFPPPPGEPAGYTEPGAVSPNRQNGYEGPTSWFSNVSTDSSSGIVHFSPAIQPGQSTYFSLEEPPISGLNAGSKPTGISAPPPTVSSSTANFTATVNPNGSPTTVRFQYSLSPKYGKLATGGAFSQATPPQGIGGDFSDHFVSAFVHGLVPNAVYEVRVEATNKNGTSFGPTLFFKTAHGTPPGSPVLGRSFNISVVSGVVLEKVHGKFVPVTELSSIPNNTIIDALGGTLKLVSAGGAAGKATDARAKKKHAKPKNSTGTFGGAVFRVTQARSGPNKGQTTLSLVEGAFKGGPSYAKCKARGAGDTAHAALSSRVLQTLRSRASGRYRTRGRYAAGTVRGTRWTTSDRCDGTRIAVQQHSVQVTDLVRHITVLVTAGHSYLAKKH